MSHQNKLMTFKKTRTTSFETTVPRVSPAIDVSGFFNASPAVPFKPLRRSQEKNSTLRPFFAVAVSSHWVWFRAYYCWLFGALGLKFFWASESRVGQSPSSFYFGSKSSMNPFSFRWFVIRARSKFSFLGVSFPCLAPWRSRRVHFLIISRECLAYLCPWRGLWA